MKRGVFICLLVIINCGLYAQSKLSVSITNPSNIHLCIPSEDVEIEVRNITVSTVSGIEIQLDLPQGITYIPSSITSSTASEKNINNLSKPIFDIDDLGLAEASTLKIKLLIDCSIRSFLNNGGLADIESTTLYTGGSVSKSSAALNIKQPSLQLQSISNQLYTADIGEVFIRQIVLKNSGTGKLASHELRRIHQSGLTFIGSNGNSNQITGDTVWTYLDSSDFVQIGNNDQYFDLNETFTIVDTLRVDQCANLAAVYRSSWGCDGICDQRTLQANVTISNKSPNLVFSPRSYSTNCMDPGSLHPQQLILYNVGNDTARAPDIHIFQAWNTGFSANILSEMDYNSFRLSTSLADTGTKIIPYKATNGGSTGIYACLNSNSVGEAFFAVPDMAPGDSLVISWNSKTCCPTLCDSRLFFAHRWKYDATYENQCAQNVKQPERWGSGGLYQNMTLSKFGPTDLLNGQTKQIEYAFSNGYLLRPISSSQLRIQLILNSGLSHSKTSADLYFTHPNGTSWTPDYFIQSGDTVTAVFNGTPKATITRGELLIGITGDCNSSSSNKDIDYSMTMMYNPDTSCSSNCYYKIYCDQDKVKVHCATTCNAGLHFNDFEAERISYGDPDNDNDGIADASGSLDLSKIKKNRVMYGDTLMTTFRADVGNAGSITNWYYGKAISKVTYGNYLSVADVRIKIYRSGNLLFNCNNINYSYTTAGNSRTFSYDISYNNLTNSGCVLYSAFSYLSADSIELEVSYVVDQNPGNAVRVIEFANDFYLSTVANPSASQKYQCDSFSAKINLIGWYFTNYGRNVINASGCSDLAISQNYYLSVGNCCSNYAGGNIFPYEYRPWAKLNGIILNKQQGFDLDYARLINYRTAGTGAVAWQRIDTIFPSSVTSTSAFYSTDSLFEDKGGPILISDDGFYGSFTPYFTPNCKAKEGNNSFEYGFVFERLGGLGSGLDTLFSGTQTDIVDYVRPSFVITPKNTYVYAESDTVEWEIRVTNSATTANAENFWLGALIGPNVNLVEVIDVSTGLALDTLADFYKAGSFAALQQRDFLLRAVYSSCHIDSIEILSGYNCTGYSSSISSYPCKKDKFWLYYEPINTRLEASLGSIPAVDLCEEREYSIRIRNTGAPRVYDLYLDLLIRPGMFVNDTAWLFVQGRTDSTLITNPNTINGNTVRWSIGSQDSILNSRGMNGVNSDSGYVMDLKIKLKTNCDFTSASSFLIRPGGYLKCGNAVQSSFTVGDPINIKGVSKPYFSSLAFQFADLDICNFQDSTNVRFINLGPDSTGLTDKIIISLPLGILIDTATAFTGHNVPTGVSYAVINGENVYEFDLLEGIAAGDSSTFELDAYLDQQLLNCGTQNLFAQAVISQPVLCVEDSSYCNINVATSSVIKTDSVEKGVYQLTFNSAKSQAAGAYETVDLQYALANSGSLKAAGNVLTVDVYFDLNLNGVVDSSDLRIATDSILTPVAQGGSIQRNLQFSVLSAYSCDLILHISDSNCLCAEVNEPIARIQLLNAGRDSILCPGQAMTIGQPGSSSNTYSWNYASLLSDPDSSSTQFQAFNNTTNLLRYMMVLSTDKGRCSSTDTAFIDILPGMQLNLSDTLKLCKGEQVLIGDPVQGGVGRLKTYQWSPTDSLSKPNGVRTYAYPNQSTLYVVEVTDDSMCQIWDSTYVKVISKPQAEIGLADGCAEQLFFFENKSQLFGEQQDSIHWTFGSLDESNFDQPAIYIDSAQQLLVSLYVSNDVGCWDTSSASLAIYPLPEASMEIRDDCEGDTTLLIANSAISTGSLSNRWYYLQDSAIADQVELSLPFATSLPIRLIAVSDKFCVDEALDTITLLDKPDISLNLADHCLNQNIEGAYITELGTVDSLTSFSWSLGDGTSLQSENWIHSYADTGRYQVQLIVLNEHGCSDTADDALKVHELPLADFVISNVCLGDSVIHLNNSSIDQGSIGQIWWDGGAGFVAGMDREAFESIAKGTFKMGLKVSSQFGCSDSIYKDYEVYHRELPALTQNGNCENEIIQLMASVTNPDSVSQLKWTIGSDSLFGNSINYQFPASGQYTIYQRVTTNRACVNLDSFEVKIDAAPVADIQFDLFCNDNQVDFIGNGISNDWNLGDGNTSQQSSFTHQYASVGTYPIRLIISNAENCYDTAYDQVSIENIVVPAFSISDRCELEPQWVIHQTNGQGVALSKALFDMGNGDFIESLDSFEYSFDKAGIYQVKLQVTTLAGCDYDSVQQIEIHPLPIADFIANPEFTDIFNAEISITDFSSGSDQLVYTLSDGSSYIVRDFVHEFQDSGLYSIKQWVSTDFGCLDSISKEVYIDYAYKLFIPNAFSPNSDQWNPEFKPVGFGLAEFYLEIYNRWGAMVFQSQEPNQAWDGKDALPGYYMYQIKAIDFRGQWHSYKGGVYLLR